MRPPVCHFCGKYGDPKTGLVGFADYRALEPGIVGHPHGLEWFCSAHFAEAEALRHLPIEVAMQRMRDRRMSWWWRWWKRRFPASEIPGNYS